MTSPSSPDRDPSPGELLARAGWPSVETALLRGLAHDLSGRAAALGGLVELLGMGDEEKPPPLELLREEAGRLGEAVELLRLLAGDGEDAEAEPLALGPLLGDVLRLHRRHRGLESVETVLETGEDVPPVRVRRDVLVRTLLLLLGAAGRAVRNADGRRLDVELAGREGRAVVTLSLSGGGLETEEGSEGGDGAAGLERAVGGVEEVLAEEGARMRTMEGGDGELRLQLSLPPLRPSGTG